MGIEIKEPQGAIDRYFEKLRKVLASNIKLQLTYLGQEAVNRVRDRGAEESWMDQTANLRASVGFAYLEEGKQIIKSAFDTVGGKGKEGSQKGKSYVEELAQELVAAYSLVIVAAMDYAEYVEAMENKDVLASTEIWVREEINKRLQRAIDNTLIKMNKTKI